MDHRRRRRRRRRRLLHGRGDNTGYAPSNQKSKNIPTKPKSTGWSMPNSFAK